MFFDDNPIEREKVRNKLKDVEVVEPNEDITSWPKQLLEFKGFSKFSISKEDKVKTKQYKIREKFVQDKNTSRDEIHYLNKKFIFKNFLESQKFINLVSQISEEEGHHPDIKFGWGYAEIEITTHAIKGLSENDFILASKIDQINQL